MFECVTLPLLLFLHKFTDTPIGNLRLIHLLNACRRRAAMRFPATSSHMYFSQSQNNRSTAHSQPYRSYKVSPTLYQSDLTISNYRGHKFPPSLKRFFHSKLEWNWMTSSVDCYCKFSELTFSTPAISKATSKLFSSQGCSDDKICIYFSSIFFKICRFRSSILLSAVSFHSTRSDARIKFESGVISWTNHVVLDYNPWTNQWDCFICIVIQKPKLFSHFDWFLSKIY